MTADRPVQPEPQRRYISSARAAVRSPRSITSSSSQPNSCRNPRATALAPSSPARNVECRPGNVRGSTIRAEFIVLSVLATLASGKAAWIRSATQSESFAPTLGGKPPEWSRALEMSRSGLPARLCAPARVSASMLTMPPVAL